MMFDMTVAQACHAFDVKRLWLEEFVTYDSGIGHTRYGGKVTSITSLDLEEALARLRKREDEGVRDGG